MSQFGPDPEGRVSTRGAWMLPDPADPAPKVLGSYRQASAYARARIAALDRGQIVHPFERPDRSVVPGAWKVLTVA